MQFAAFFGWPMVVVTVALGIIGLWMNRTSLLVLSAILALPFLSYLAATPRFALAAPVVALLCWSSVLMLWRGHVASAVALFIPFLWLVAFVACLVWGGEQLDSSFVCNPTALPCSATVDSP